MLSHQTKTHRSALAMELRQLGDFFSQQKIAQDSIPLHKAATHCRSDESAEENRWKYSIERLRFILSHDLKAHPPGIYDAQLEVSITVSGPCVLDSEFHDPLLTLEAEISVSGRCPTRETLLCAWHFDRHISSDQDNEPFAPHPRYHMHFGGRKMTNSAFDFGSTLMLPGPRLAQPPLDGILFIDFVLASFAENKWRHVRKNPLYLRLVRTAQIRLWKPYVRAIGGAWVNPVPAEWSPHDAWPLVCS